MLGDWKALLGERLLEANAIDEIPVLIASTVVNHQKAQNETVAGEQAVQTETETETSSGVADML